MIAMKKYLGLFILIIFTIPMFSQIDTTSVAFVAYWSVGDSYDFKVSKVKQQWKEGELTKDELQTYVANFTVIDSTETSYTINWSYENDLGSTYNIPKELVDKFSKYKLTNIVYQTSELGDFLEILNWKEIAAMTNNLFDDIIEVLGENDEKKKEALSKAMDPLRQIYSSQQGVEQLVMKEIQSFHFPMGLEFDITEPLVYEEELPNMFGGKPIKANAKLYFENVDFEEGFCTIKQEMALDPEDTKKMLENLFVQMKLDDKGMKKALKSAVFEIEDRNTFDYYYYPGIPHRIETIRESVIVINDENGKGIDKMTIELIYND